MVLWSLASLFFAFQFILRLSTGILREEIIQKFSIDTIAFGTLAGYYYLGYAGMQLPIGLMLDKFDFRIVTFFSIVVSALGTLTFVITSDFNYLLIGRLMIGAGSAVGFLSVAKVTTNYFPVKYHPLMLGFSFTFGLIGAVFGVTPMKLLFNHFGYYYTFYTLAGVALAIGVMMLLIKNDKEPKEVNTQEAENNKSLILTLFFNPTILLIGIFGGLMVGSLEGFADVWAIPFFTQVYHFSEMESTVATSLIYVGMCFGGPILAFMATLFRSNNSIIVITGIMMVAIFTILLSFASLNFFVTSALMVLLGIFCCYQVLVFAIASKLVPSKSAGLAIAIINCINMSFGHIFHKLISNLISYNWDGLVNAANAPIYSRNDFIVSFCTIPIFCIVGVMGFMYLSKKSKVRMQTATAEEVEEVAA